MNKVKFEKSIIKRLHYPSVILCFACCVMNACSSGEDSMEDTFLSSEYNIYIIDNDTISYSTEEIAEPFNNTDKMINSALEDYSITMLIDYSKNNKKNTLLSPMSATLLYSMISNLTDDTSGHLFQKQLGLDKFNSDDVNSYCRKLNYRTKQSEKTNKEFSKFSMSNNCWIQKDEAVYRSFMSMTKSFGIGVKGVDFKSLSGLTVIGESLKGMSSSKSYDIDMTSLNDVTSVVTSSMDLEKKWKHNVTQVKNQTFNNADGTVSTCSAIGGTLTVKYGKYESFDMAELPYSDGEFSLYVIYPHSVDSFDQSLTYIQDIGIEKCIDDLEETKVSIRIPTFKFEGITELNSVSVSSGSAGKQFYQAKLTKASPKGFNIGNTYQAYRIELNSQGTSVEVKSSGKVDASNESNKKIEPIGPGSTPEGGIILPQMHIVRPFVILIRNNVLKTVAYACGIKDLSE